MEFPVRHFGLLLLPAVLHAGLVPQPPARPAIPAPARLDPAAGRIFRRAAAGDAAAQFFAGRSCCLGAGVPEDYAEAAKWFRKAAEQGNADAQCELGFFCERGAGVPQDAAEAVKWYRLAAARGHGAALASLGVLVFRGEGTASDHVQGYAFLLSALATRGRDFSQSKFTEQMTREEVTQAKQIALDFLKQLSPLSSFLARTSALPEPERPKVPRAEDPDPVSPEDRSAMIQLGEIDLGLEGSPERIPRRIALLKDLASRGVPYAQYELGRACEIGEGVPRDPAAAAQWYRKAAEAGNADAQYNLAMMLDAGDGVPQDPAEARKWFAKAAATVPARPVISEAELLRDEMDDRKTRLAKDLLSAYRFFLILRNAGNPEAQPLLDRMDQVLTKNQTAECRYYAEAVWVRIRPD
jgi:TPR repeat protein